MNIHLKCTPCSECEAVKVKCSAHRMTAQILRLLVDLILDETAAKSSARSTRTTTTENDRSRRENNFVLHRACKAIDDILKTIPSCTMSLLQHLGDTISLEKHVSKTCRCRLHAKFDLFCFIRATLIWVFV